MINLKGGRLSNKDLAKMFDVINRRYFKHALAIPADISFRKRMFSKKNGEPEPEGECGDGFIHVLDVFRSYPDIVWLILIHEMIHWAYPEVRLDASHGYQFGFEVTRLFNEGAYQDVL